MGGGGVCAPASLRGGRWGGGVRWGDRRVSRCRPWSHLTAQPMAITSVTMIEHMKYVLFVRGIGQGEVSGWVRVGVKARRKLPV